MSGDICALLTGSENWFDKFFSKISFGHNLFILQPTVTNFSRGLVGEENFLMTIWLPWKIGYHSNKSLYFYLTKFKPDSNKTWQVGSTNENLSKKNVLYGKLVTMATIMKLGYHGNCK